MPPMAASVGGQVELRSNKISMRGPEICAEIMNKFEFSDKRFKKFVQNTSTKNFKKHNTIDFS